METARFKYDKETGNLQTEKTENRKNAVTKIKKCRWPNYSSGLPSSWGHYSQNQLMNDLTNLTYTHNPSTKPDKHNFIYILMSLGVRHQVSDMATYNNNNDNNHYYNKDQRLFPTFRKGSRVKNFFLCTRSNYTFIPFIILAPVASTGVPGLSPLHTP